MERSFDLNLTGGHPITDVIGTHLESYDRVVNRRIRDDIWFTMFFPEKIVKIMLIPQNAVCLSQRPSERYSLVYEKERIQCNWNKFNS